MLSTFQLAQLIDPVLCRAQATYPAIRSDFVDQAARSVLERLGYDDLSSVEPAVWNQRNPKVCRWQWIDQQASQFFRAAPNGLGIEVDGGLSTRCDRVSGQLDWPRFAWCTVNVPDVVDCLHYAFPPRDNYSHIACDQPSVDWVRYVPWHDPKPKMVFLGDQNPLLKWEDFVHLSVDIQSKLTNETPSLDVVLTHSIASLDDKIHAALFDNIDIALLNAMSTPKPAGLLGGLTQYVSDLLADPSATEAIYVHHLVFRSQSQPINTEVTV